MHTARSVLCFLNAYLEEAISIVCVALIAFCIILQVILRYLFHTSAPWAPELATYGMAWAVYIGAALAVRERAHLRIMDGVFLLPRPIATAVVVLSDSLWVAFNLFMVWQGALYIELLWDRTYVSPALGIDQKWPQAIVPIGFGLMTLRVLQRYVRWVAGGYRGFP